MGKSQKKGQGARAAVAPAASAKIGRESSAWPSTCKYLTSLVWGDDVRAAKDVYQKYKRSADGKHVEANASATKRNVRWQLITDERHPAKGEYGLFAQRKMERGEHIIDYLGLVTLKGNESKTSDYTASFGDDNELALDAELMGNEARMINDFRNTGKRANALFDQYRDAAGDLKLGVFAGLTALTRLTRFWYHTAKGSGRTGWRRWVRKTWPSFAATGLPPTTKRQKRRRSKLASS